MCKTYSEVASKYGLSDSIRERYIRYMIQRWESTEEQKCPDGYAIEWAERFKNGLEYSASDLFGQEILRSIDSDLNNR